MFLFGLNVIFLLAAFRTDAVEYSLGRIYYESVMFCNMTAYLSKMVTVQMYQLSAVEAFQVEVVVTSLFLVDILKAGAGLSVE